MDMEFASMLNRKETLKLQDLNAAFTDPRTISLAYFEASLLVEHIVATYGDAGLHKLLRAYGTGPRHRRRAEVGAQHRPRPAAGRLRPDARADVRQAARGARSRPTRAPTSRRCRSTSCRTYAAQHQGSYAAQMTLGDALRKAGDLDERDARVRARRGARADRDRRRQPARADRRDRAAEEGHRARDRRAAGARRRRLRQRRGRAEAGRR